MTEASGAWPFVDRQCPHCRYFYAYEDGRTDDKGYALPGFCRHPRIAMELFSSTVRDDFSKAGCSLYARGVCSDLGDEARHKRAPER